MTISVLLSMFSVVFSFSVLIYAVCQAKTTEKKSHDFVSKKIESLNKKDELILSDIAGIENCVVTVRNYEKLYHESYAALEALLQKNKTMYDVVLESKKSDRAYFKTFSEMEESISNINRRIDFLEIAVSLHNKNDKEENLEKQ